MDLVETTILLPDIFSSFLLFVFSLDFRRCWRFSDQVDNDLKSKKCFLIGIRIFPSSTGVYRVDVGVTPGSAVSVLGSAVLAPGCPGLYRVHAGVTLGLLCRHRGLPYWHRGVPGSTVFTPGSAVLLIGTVLTPGSAMFTPGWLSSRQPSTRFFSDFIPVDPGIATGVYRARPQSHQGLPCLVWLALHIFIIIRNLNFLENFRDGCSAIECNVLVIFRNQYYKLNILL